MSLLQPMQSSLTDEGLCRSCDNAQWFEGAVHNCRDGACACPTCHSPIEQVNAVFDALDELLAIAIPRPRRVARRNRVATPA